MHERNGSGCAFYVEQNAPDGGGKIEGHWTRGVSYFVLAGGVERKMRNTQANREKALINSALRVMRSPTRHILKQADGANSFVGAYVEQVTSAAWKANEGSRLNLDRH